ncbi:MAG: TM0106 family RecB-like putative nuclease [Micrococcus sp.]|nr:TM0106 family RecB-like putative nuclease [Micrococcus sp.]
MVRLLDADPGFLLSPSDLTAAAGCEYGWLRLSVDPKAGHLPPREDDEDAFLATVARLGDAHEERILAQFVQEHGEDQVVRLARPRHYTPEGIAEAVAATRAALEDGPAVVFQAMLHDGRFGGLADFLVRQEDGAYAVVDTKLARHARVTALLQIAAYADLLDGLGIPRAREGSLWLGDDSQVHADLNAIIPVYRHQRERLTRLLEDHLAAGVAAQWGDDRLSICGQCDACAEAIAEHQDVLMVAGSSRLQRARLRAAGVTTVAELAASSSAPEGMSERTWRGLRDQARLQQDSPGPDGLPAVEVMDAAVLANLPTPSPGDMFFDFEGDPLWMSAAGHMEGLEYLFGWAQLPDTGPDSTAECAYEDFEFHALWSDDRAAERAALDTFVQTVERRRAEFPNMRIYHYAPYEITALKRLTNERHGIHAEVLDDWLRAGLFVDLYSTVRSALRVGTSSYSIKKLEPLYMGDEHRDDDGVTTAADSVTEYHRYIAVREAGRTSEAEQIADAIRAYNRYDCISTARLRDWLLSLVEPGVRDASRVSTQDAVHEFDVEPSPAAAGAEQREAFGQSLMALLPSDLQDGVWPTTEQDPSGEYRGILLLAAALGFFSRENKPLWWAMFDRAVSAPDEWPEPRCNLVFDSVEAVGEWVKPAPRKNPVRQLTVTGRLEPGTEIRPPEPGRETFKLVALYDDPPAWAEMAPNAVRWQSRSAVNATNVEEISPGRFRIQLDQRLSIKHERTSHTEIPMGVFHLNYVSPGAILERIMDRASCTSSRGRLQPGVLADVLTRRAPRHSDGEVKIISSEVRSGQKDSIAGLVEALESARGSYVAVQGPPGTGKTHVGSHAVKALLDRGWSVGVIAQSHAVVENFLDKLVDIGVDPKHVGKEPKNPDVQPSWTVLEGTEQVHSFLQPGRVLGGTSWTFSSRSALPVDLLVVDEAGQLSLAYLAGASEVAETVLLLGDPQQLPQVSKGMHPYPVDQAALTWLSEGHAVLPQERGFFLDTSWRMHSALTEVVSELSYDGELRSRTEVTDARRLDGIAPGLHPVPVSHVGNAVSSPEEAEAVVAIVRDVVGRAWTDPARDDGAPRQLEPSDVIVVAPYNAQVATVRDALDAAGFTDTTVGTVDKFQGREAPVAVLTMAASSAQDVPRGLDFLLNRNRLNVSISRGQWAAYLVHSPALADALPTSPHDLAMVGAFLRLIHRPAPVAMEE